MCEKILRTGRVVSDQSMSAFGASRFQDRRSGASGTIESTRLPISEQRPRVSPVPLALLCAHLLTQCRRSHYTVQVNRVPTIHTKSRTVFIINTTNYGLCVCGVHSIARGIADPRKPFATPSASRAISNRCRSCRGALPRAASPCRTRERLNQVGSPPRFIVAIVAIAIAVATRYRSRWSLPRARGKLTLPRGGIASRETRSRLVSRRVVEDPGLAVAIRRSLDAASPPCWRVPVRGIGKHRHACASDRARPRALSLSLSLSPSPIASALSSACSLSLSLSHLTMLSSSLFCFVLLRGWDRDARRNVLRSGLRDTCFLQDTLSPAQLR